MGMGFSLNRSLNTHVIKILRLFNLWELAFWHHLTQKDHDFLSYLLKYLWGYFNYRSAQSALEIERKTDFQFSVAPTQLKSATRHVRMYLIMRFCQCRKILAIKG